MTVIGKDGNTRFVDRKTHCTSLVVNYSLLIYHSVFIDLRTKPLSVSNFRLRPSTKSYPPDSNLYNYVSPELPTELSRANLAILL